MTSSRIRAPKKTPEIGNWHFPSSCAREPGINGQGMASPDALRGGGLHVNESEDYIEAHRVIKIVEIKKKKKTLPALCLSAW